MKIRGDDNTFKINELYQHALIDDIPLTLILHLHDNPATDILNSALLMKLFQCQVIDSSMRCERHHTCLGDCRDRTKEENEKPA